MNVKTVKYNESGSEEFKNDPGVHIERKPIIIEVIANPADTRKAFKERELRRAADKIREKLKGSSSFGIEIDINNPDEIICEAYQMGYQDAISEAGRLISIL